MDNLQFLGLTFLIYKTEMLLNVWYCCDEKRRIEYAMNFIEERIRKFKVCPRDAGVVEYVLNVFYFVLFYCISVNCL